MRGAVGLLGALALAGCSSWISDSGELLGFVSPHRIDIQQGNVVTQEQLDRVRPGMNRLQVRDVLGSPLLVDAFHADRWDYIFTLRKSGAPPQRRSVTLFFEGDVLKRVEAPELPTELEFIDSISRGGRTVAANELQLTPEQIKALPTPAPAASAPRVDGAPTAPPRQYPPLEPS